MIRSLAKGQFVPTASMSAIVPSIRAISQTCHIRRLEAAGQDAIRTLGFDHYALVLSGPRGGLPVSALSTLPAAIWQDLLAHGLYLRNPVVDAIIARVGGLILGPNTFVSPQGGSDLCSYAGLALVSVVSAAQGETVLIAYSRDAAPGAETLKPLALLGSAMSIRLLALHGGSVASSLSELQADILHWAAEGKSNGDIATILGISRRGCDYHLGEIYKKLGVASRAQAVAAYSQIDSDRHTDPRDADAVGQP